jgi:predicted RND superfamily exporter protein
LFFGFGIFVASGFKGTVFLGLLVSITLLIGMISNLILLPCFLMTLDKKQSLKQSKNLV